VITDPGPIRLSGYADFTTLSSCNLHNVKNRCHDDALKQLVALRPKLKIAAVVYRRYPR
jgi:hypothetical protein